MSATEEPTDLALVEAANRGDARAFEALYERYRDWVYGLALRLTGDRELALDIVQDTFTYLLRKFPGFRLTAQMKTFLYPVIRHIAVAAAARAREELGAGAGADREAEAVPGPGPDLAGLAAAVAALPPGQREVLLLRFADGLALAEIAAALEVPLGTFKSRLHLALKALRADQRLADLF